MDISPEVAVFLDPQMTRGDSNPLLSPSHSQGTPLGRKVGEALNIFRFIFILLSSQARSSPVNFTSVSIAFRCPRWCGGQGHGEADWRTRRVACCPPGDCEHFLYFVCIPSRLVLLLCCN